MREKIIKLLKSDNVEDRTLGKEFLRKFYKEEIFTIGNSTAAVLWASDLNRILQTDVFVYDMHNPYIHSRDLVILFKDDNWNMV